MTFSMEYTISNPEDFIICPYDDSHKIRAMKLQYHLMKCRKNHPGHPKKQCPFNAGHWVPDVELRFHMADCVDRQQITGKIAVENAMVEAGQTGNVEIPAYQPFKTTGDSWEHEIPKVPVHNRMIAGPPVEETIIRAPRKVEVTLTEEETRGLTPRQRLQLFKKKKEFVSQGKMSATPALRVPRDEGSLSMARFQQQTDADSDTAIAGLQGPQRARGRGRGIGQQLGRSPLPGATPRGPGRARSLAPFAPGLIPGVGSHIPLGRGQGFSVPAVGNVGTNSRITNSTVGTANLGSNTGHTGVNSGSAGAIFNMRASPVNTAPASRGGPSTSMGATPIHMASSNVMAMTGWEASSLGSHGGSTSLPSSAGDAGMVTWGSETGGWLGRGAPLGRGQPGPVSVHQEAPRQKKSGYGPRGNEQTALLFGMAGRGQMGWPAPASDQLLGSSPCKETTSQPSETAQCFQDMQIARGRSNGSFQQNSSFASVAGDDPKLSFDFSGEKYASDDGEPEQFADALSWVGGGYDTPAGPGRSVSTSSSLSDLQMAYAGATGSWADQMEQAFPLNQPQQAMYVSDSSDGDFPEPGAVLTREGAIKKLRIIKKKLRRIDQLEARKRSGESLEPKAEEQLRDKGFLIQQASLIQQNGSDLE